MGPSLLFFFSVTAHEQTVPLSKLFPSMTSLAAISFLLESVPLSPVTGGASLPRQGSRACSLTWMKGLPWAAKRSFTPSALDRLPCSFLFGAVSFSWTEKPPSLRSLHQQTTWKVFPKHFCELVALIPPAHLAQPCSVYFGPVLSVSRPGSKLLQTENVHPQNAQQCVAA